MSASGPSGPLVLTCYPKHTYFFYLAYLWFLFVGVEEELASIYLRHGLTSRADGKEQDSKKLTYLSKVALFDGKYREPVSIRVSNSLDPDQARRFVRPDLGPNILQRLSKK